jgi:hypothetical protein
MKDSAQADFTAAALAVVLAAGILTLWMPQRWALGVYQTAVLLLTAAWTIRVVARPGAEIVYRAVWVVPGLVAAWGVGQLALGLTVQPWATTTAALDWSCWAAIAFLASQALQAGELRRRFLAATMTFGALLGIVATLQVFTSEGRIFWLFPSGYRDLVLGPFVYRNQYAAFVEMVVPVLLYTGLRRRRRALYWGATAILMASVVAGASRAGTLLVTAEVVVVMALAVRKRHLSGRTFWLACGQIGLGAAVAVAVIGWAPLWNRFQQADPYSVRREMLISSLAMIKDRPAVGFGLGAWPAAYPGYALFDDGQFANQAHNDWAQWAVEGGLPALAAMVWLAVSLAAPAVRSVWGLGVLFVLAHSLVDYPLQQRPQLAGWFFALAGAVAAWEYSRRRSEDGRPP